ncbi:hypothetical protein Tco_1058034 [Tanacetum coccineum]|uniref:Uncharacterized protein n=1 Tax=Tanacetum coccineum TaxID=301880 RepID=A0ABQ5H8Z5_9ASTR
MEMEDNTGTGDDTSSGGDTGSDGDGIGGSGGEGIWGSSDDHGEAVHVWWSSIARSTEKYASGLLGGCSSSPHNHRPLMSTSSIILIILDDSSRHRRHLFRRWLIDWILPQGPRRHLLGFAYRIGLRILIWWTEAVGEASCRQWLLLRENTSSYVAYSWIFQLCGKHMVGVGTVAPRGPGMYLGDGGTFDIVEM